MVMAFSSIFSRSSSQKSPHRPMFTSIPTSWSNQNNSRITGFNSKYFWSWFKQSPELIATLSVPITDIMGDRPLWTDVNGNELNTLNKKKAENFWRNNRGKETVKAYLFDKFLTGDGYFWKGKATKKELRMAIKEAVKQCGFGLSPLQMKELAVKAAMDEDLKKTRRFDYVASSSMLIIHDEFEIMGYEQTSQGRKIMFNPEEIIHGRHMTLNGNVEGFSPVEALTAELLLLQLVKKNMVAFMRNGGTPDKMFILPKEMAKSNNHRFLVEQLRKYKRVQNRHGNLVFTGEIKVEDLQGNPKDLEYKDLALYITSNIAFSFKIPVTRIPYLIGTSANKGDSGGLSESGYWNSISEEQDTLEDLLNGQLFEELGWRIKFPRKYKQDEVREAQTKSMTADTVTKYQEILMENGKQLTEKKLLNVLKFNKEDIEEFKMNPMAEHEMRNQNMLPNKELNREQDKLDSAQTRRNSANRKGIGAAVANP